MPRGSRPVHDESMTSTVPPPAPHGVTDPAHRVVDRLVAEQLLHPAARERAVDVVAGVLRSPVPASGPARGGTSAVVEVVAYLGAALVLAAGSLFGFSYWDGLDLGARVGLLAVMTLVLGASGLAAGRGHVTAMRRRDEAIEPRRRLVSTLLSGSALALAGLVGLVVERVTGTPDYDVATLDWPLAAASAAALAAAVLGRRVADSALGTLVAFGSLVTLVTTVVTRFDGEDELGLCAALLVLALGWLLLTELREEHAPTLGRVLGAGLALYAAQMPTWAAYDTDWLGYLLTAVLAVGGTAAYLRRGAWPYLAVAVVAVTVVVPEAVYDWTGGGLGAIGAVLLTGVTLLLASGLGGLLRQRHLGGS